MIYDKAIAAGKSIWVKVYSGEFEDWIRNVDRIVNKYGSHSLFLLFPEMSMEQAAYLLDYADRNWSDVKGTFVESLGNAQTYAVLLMEVTHIQIKFVLLTP